LLGPPDLNDNVLNVEEFFDFQLSDEILGVDPVTTGENAMPTMSGCVFNNCTFHL
jgi:hypothetical protein